MASEWEEVAIADAPLEIIDGDRGTNYPKQDDFASVGHCLFLNAGNVTNTGFNFSNCSFISQDKDAALRKGKAKRDDVVMTTRGTVGNVALYDASVPYEHVRINSGMVLLRTDTSKLSPRFLYQFVRSAIFQERVVALTTGSAQPQLPIRDIRRIEFPLPPLTEQHAIAHILGTLDDKIELNRRRNQTLEAMARALFKDWFVDFGPVRAKMEGRESYLSADLWQLFPDRLDDEGKPEGWVQQSVGDIGAIICGKTPPTKNAEYYGDDVPFITIPEMHGNIFATDVKKRLSHHGAQSQQKKTLPPGSICVSCIATLGLVVITTEPSQTNQQINSVIPHQEDETYFWYWSLKNLGDEIKAGGSGGSVLGNLSTGRFSELRVNASSRPLRLAYNARVENLFSQILANELESQSLAQLRDTLLPKLISGELRINDAEQFLERAEDNVQNKKKSLP